MIICRRKYLIERNTLYQMHLWSDRIEQLDDFSVSINFNREISFFDHGISDDTLCNMQLLPQVEDWLISTGMRYSTYVVQSHYVNADEKPNVKPWYFSSVHNVLQLTSYHDLMLLRLTWF